MCVDGEISSANCLHLMTEADSSISEHTIKIRKPYIITKQREKWTDEEHNKFLEALKLYGRAWRRIEEHVGSKTTVQIRSHAQKFFSKVTRESSSTTPGTVKAIVIPPPRPKRKPTHPYPRKLGHLFIGKGPSTDGKLWSSLPKPSVSEQESKSPTSVLSAFGSYTTGKTASDTPNPCMSPVSSVDRIVMVDEILVEQGSGSKSSSTSSEYKDNQSTDPSTFLGMHDLSPMELDLGIQNSCTPKEVPFTGQQITSLKLFGRTVIVGDMQEQTLSNNNELDYQDSFSDCNKIYMESQQLQEKHSSDALLCISRDECNPSYGGISPNMVPFPSWWDMYGIMHLQFSSSMNPTLDQSPDNFVHINPTSNESSQTDTCTISDRYSEASESDVQMKEFSCAFELKPSKNSAFSRLTPSPPTTRGFVPYKKMHS